MSTVIETVPADVRLLGPNEMLGFHQHVGIATLTLDNGTEIEVNLSHTLTGMQLYAYVDGHCGVYIDLQPHVQHLCELAAAQPTREFLRQSETGETS